MLSSATLAAVGAVLLCLLPLLLLSALFGRRTCCADSCADIFGGGARTLADTLADSLLERDTTGTAVGRETVDYSI